MSLKLKNDWNYKGNDRWDWEVYLVGEDPKELEDVQEVKYILHPTFRQPIRIIDKSTGDFRLKTNGWGTFQIRAFAYFKGGDKVKLEHELYLAYDPLSGTSP